MNIGTYKKIIAWGKYLFWAETCKNRLEDLFDSSNSPDEISRIKFFTYSSQWFGSLYVAIEGWEALKLKDDTISTLLVEHMELKSLLRKYRNCVFHFQPKLIDNRFVDFWKANDNSYLWARFFPDWLASVPGDKAQKHEIKNSRKELIDWIPQNTFTDSFRNLDMLIHESELMLNKSHKETEATIDFRNFINQIKQTIPELKSNYDDYLEESQNSIRNEPMFNEKKNK